VFDVSSMETDFDLVDLDSCPPPALPRFTFFLATGGSPLSAKCAGGRRFRGPSTMLGSVRALDCCGGMLTVSQNVDEDPNEDSNER